MGIHGFKETKVTKTLPVPKKLKLGCLYFRLELKCSFNTVTNPNSSWRSSASYNQSKWGGFIT